MKTFQNTNFKTQIFTLYKNQIFTLYLITIKMVNNSNTNLCNLFCILQILLQIFANNFITLLKNHNA